MRRAFFFFWHLYLVADFFISAFFISLITRNEIARRTKQSRNTTRIARKFRKAFRIQTKVHNPEKLAAMSNQAFLAICNHVSYTDIILLAALDDFVFITSVEMGNNPFLGAITRYGGCLYTNRKKFVSLPKEIEKFATTIKQGFKVMLFPEGTSTNGDTVKEFRSSLFQTALLAKCPLLPICIRYKTLDGNPINDPNRDSVYWYGDMDFAPHFMKLLGHRIEADIYILDPIPYCKDKTRQELSQEVYGHIHACFHETAPYPYNDNNNDIKIHK